MSSACRKLNLIRISEPDLYTSKKSLIAMSQNTTPAAPVPTDPARLQAGKKEDCAFQSDQPTPLLTFKNPTSIVDVRDGPPKVGGTPASAQPAETEERDHDPLASAAIMNVHPTKEGLNLITPAGGCVCIEGHLAFDATWMQQLLAGIPMSDRVRQASSRESTQSSCTPAETTTQSSR